MGDFIPDRLLDFDRRFDLAGSSQNVITEMYVKNENVRKKLVTGIKSTHQILGGGCG